MKTKIHPEQTTLRWVNVPYFPHGCSEVSHTSLPALSPRVKVAFIYSKYPRPELLIYLTPPKLITRLWFNYPDFSSSQNDYFSLSHLKLLLEEGNLLKKIDEYNCSIRRDAD